MLKSGYAGAHGGVWGTGAGPESSDKDYVAPQSGTDLFRQWLETGGRWPVASAAVASGPWPVSGGHCPVSDCRPMAGVRWPVENGVAGGQRSGVSVRRYDHNNYDDDDEDDHNNFSNYVGRVCLDHRK